MCPDCALGSGVRIDPGARSARVLRMLLMMVVDRGAAAASLEGVGDVEVLWPSAVFSLLAASSARSPQSFRRAARLLDDALSTPPLRAMTPVQLAVSFASGRDSLSPRALAAIVWELLRRRDPAVDVLIDRVAAELELVAAQRAGAPLGVPSCGVEPVLASRVP